jgi:hypothetical protein
VTEYASVAAKRPPHHPDVSIAQADLLKAAKEYGA